MTVTLVGVFDTMKEAQQARSRLHEEGVADASIRVESGTDASSPTSSMSNTAQTGDDVDRRGFWDKLFGWMSDDDDDDDRRTVTQHYDEAVRRGNAVLTVSLDDASRADYISDLLDDCGAVDVDERVAQWRGAGYASPALGSVAASGDVDGGQTLQSIEEQLKIGKQTVQRGRVRIHRSTSERPVEEQVALHDERVRVERKPVDRAATEADLSGAFEDRHIELTETTEEAVVAKTARVVEEVRLRTDATDRVETVHDTVRSTEFDIEKMDDKSAPTRSGAASGHAANAASASTAAGSSRMSGGSGGSMRSDLSSAGGAAGTQRSGGVGGLGERAGSSFRKGTDGYGGAERRRSADMNYSGPERRMAAA